MTDVLRIAHPQNCPPYGNSRVGICEGNLLIVILFIAKSIRQRHRQRYRQRHRRKLSASNTQCMVYFFILYFFKEFTS